MHVRKSGITERALRKSLTHGPPEMYLRHRRNDPPAPEVVIVSSRVFAHRASSLFVSLSSSQSLSTHRKTRRARRRHLRVREYIPAQRDTHHTKTTNGDARSEPPRTQLMYVLACMCACESLQKTDSAVRSTLHTIRPSPPSVLRVFPPHYGSY